MSLTYSDRTPLLQWAVVFALLALSPTSQALPWGMALAATGLLGSALLLRVWRPEQRPAVVSYRWRGAHPTGSRP